MAKEILALVLLFVLIVAFVGGVHSVSKAPDLISPGLAQYHAESDSLRVMPTDVLEYMFDPKTNMCFAGHLWLNDKYYGLAHVPCSEEVMEQIVWQENLSDK